jgi:hypothetical protein
MRVRIAESTQGYAAPPEWFFRGEKFVLGCLDCFSDRARTPERGVGADRGDAVCYSACKIDPLSRGIGVQN